MQKNPLVSILVPVYNTQDYLAQCLDSILAQTLSDFEVIAINDGSTDRSTEILRQYAQRDPRVRVIEKQNTGYGDSMNRGLSEASGEYIGIVEPDDYIDAAMYERYVKAIRTADADVLKSNYFEHCEGRRDVRTDLFGSLGIAYGRPFDPTDYPLVLTTNASIWAGLYRRSFLEREGIDFAPTPGASFQDASFSHMCWIAAERAVVLREAYLRYRVDNQASSSNSGAKVYAVCAEFERSRRFLGERAKASAERRGNEKMQAFGPVLGAVRYGNYAWNYNRIAPEYRAKFARRWSREMVDLEREGMLELDVFDFDTLNDIRLLMGDPQEFGSRFADGMPWRGYSLARQAATSDGRVLSYRDLHIAGPVPGASAVARAASTSDDGVIEMAVDAGAGTGADANANRGEAAAPGISVIVPIYEVEAYIRECVESLLAQTFRDFEVVCVDDGSPDASVTIARASARQDPRFRFVSQPNGGLSNARNHGMREARGSYLLFLDSDDMLVPDALERLHARAIADDLDYLDFTAHTFYESARVRRVNDESCFEQRDAIDGVMAGTQLFVEYMDRDQYYCPACFHFFKRDLAERAGLTFAEGVIHEDELFSPLLIAHAQRAAYLNEPLYLRRMRADSIMTTQRGIKNIKGMLYASRELENWLRGMIAEGEGQDERFVAAMAKRIAFLRGIAVSDATFVTPEDLTAYAETLPSAERIDFEMYVTGGLAIRQRAFEDLEFHRIRKVGHVLLEVPRSIKDALEDRANR